MKDSEIKNELMSLVSKKFKLSKDHIFFKSLLINDLNISSFEALDLISDVEERFNCDIPDDEIFSIRKAEDLIALIKKYGK